MVTQTSDVSRAIRPADGAAFYGSLFIQVNTCQPISINVSQVVGAFARSNRTRGRISTSASTRAAHTGAKSNTSTAFGTPRRTVQVRARPSITNTVEVEMKLSTQARKNLPSKSFAL